MLLKTILNRIDWHKSFVYGNDRIIKEGDRLAIEIDVKPRANGRPICSVCGLPGPCHDRIPRPRRFEYVPLWGMAVYLVYTMRRVNCPTCGVKVERVPWSEGKERLTTRYQWFLASWAKRICWQEVACVFGTTWEHVFRSVKHAVSWGLDHRDFEGVESIGVDEIQWQRGHKYLTLVYQIDAGCRRLLWVGRDRTTKTLLRFFRKFGKERSAVLCFVCSDMWQPYLKVIAKKAPQSIHVLDRFHIMAKMNKAIDEVRAGEAKRLERDGYEPVLKHSRWCLLKREENLTEKQAVKLSELLQYNLQSVRSRLMREDFQRFWEYIYPACAGKFLDEWCTRTMRSKIEPLKKVAKTLRRHRELILNWFRAEGTISSGIVEGLNNKAKLTMRKAYGFRTAKAIEIALYHQLGNLPEPKFTHRFC
ncbi:MAG: ISL3 family transposase [Chloroflexota bacterium]|nr:ISL3 family transposase [Chloroflexota bacterium]